MSEGKDKNGGDPLFNDDATLESYSSNAPGQTPPPRPLKGGVIGHPNPKAFEFPEAEYHPHIAAKLAAEKRIGAVDWRWDRGNRLVPIAEEYRAKPEGGRPTVDDLELAGIPFGQVIRDPQTGAPVVIMMEETEAVMKRILGDKFPRRRTDPTTDPLEGIPKGAKSR